MAVRVNINGITGGTEPYDVYVCQPNNTSCFYISTIMDSDLNPYEFDMSDRPETVRHRESNRVQKRVRSLSTLKRKYTMMKPFLLWNLSCRN